MRRAVTAVLVAVAAAVASVGPAAPATAAGRKASGPCSLLTKAQVADLLGARVEDGRPDRGPGARGVVALEGCYPLSVLASLNDRLDPLDPLFDDTAGESRAYVGADALASSGCGWRVPGRATPVIDPPELLISV